MKLGRIFKTIFLLEFISGLSMAIKELLESQKPSIILLKKDQSAHE